MEFGQFCKKTPTGLKCFYDLLEIPYNMHCSFVLTEPSLSARNSRLNGEESTELLSPLSCCIGQRD